MSIDDETGNKLILASADTWRWQRHLFAEIQTAPGSRAAMDRLREAWETAGPSGWEAVALELERYWVLDDPAAADTRHLLQSYRLPPDLGGQEALHAMHRTAYDLRLTWHNQPAPWAVLLLFNDMYAIHDGGPANLHERFVQLCISHNVASASVFRDVKILESPHYHDDAVWHEETRNNRSPMIDDAAWKALEKLAIDAAKRAVADMRAELATTGAGDPFSYVTIHGKRDAQKALQVTRLALRIMNRAGGRNHPQTDRRWCKRLNIDVPPHR